jgi:hypothetical protein
MNDDDVDWVRIDLHDPDCVQWLETQAGAQAADARADVEHVARRAGADAAEIARVGAEAERLVIEASLVNLAALRRRSTH